jgi:hypothetical protein
MRSSFVTIALRRGETSKPCSARTIAGSKSFAHGSLPCRLCASASSATVPGTPTDFPPITAA